MTGELISATALLAANALLLGATAIELLRVRRAARRWREPPAPAPAAAATDEARRLLGALDARIAELRDLAQGLAPGTPGAPPPASPAFASSPFDRAAQLARNGASADELARACGLNRGAAELLVRLHAAGPEAAGRAGLSRAAGERSRPAAVALAGSRLRD